MKDEEMAEEWVRTKHNILKDCLSACVRAEHKNEIQAFLDGPKAGRPQWHKLDCEKDFPDVDKLVRVRTRSGEEYICETYSYRLAEDEIGYGSVITQFEELNGDWVDDSDIEYWCEIPTFDKE